jgi:hypothetical protein
MIAVIDAEDWSLTLPPRRSDSDSDSGSDSGDSSDSDSSDDELVVVELEAEHELVVVEPEAEHVGIWCDECRMKPLRGARFTKQLIHDTFDLCQGCFNHLSESEQAEFKQATAPTSSQDARVEAARVAAEEEAARAAAEEEMARGAAEEEMACLSAEEEMADFQPVEPQLNEVTAQVPIGEALSCTIAPGVCAFEAGDEAIYTPTGETVTVLVVHFDDAPNTYFTIRMAQGSERQTPAERLIKPSEAQHTSQADEDASTAPVLDCTDLSASCIADIQVGLDQEQAAETTREAVEAEAAREAAEAEAVREAAEAEAAREAEAVREAAEVETHVSSVPVEWQSSIQALKDMGFSSSVATDSIVKAGGNLDAALEAAFNFVPPAPPAAALVAIRSEPVWEEAWDLVLLELEEMGFCDVESNKHFVESNNGDLKATVTALVADERSKR